MVFCYIQGMHKQLLQSLEKANFSENEAKTYLALLELGDGTVEDIAKTAKIKRTSMYAILEVLEARGLVSKTTVKKHTYYVAEKPETILESLRENVESFSKTLPLFTPIYTEQNQKPRVYFLSGSEGFKKAWKFVLESGIKDYMIITDPKEMLGFVRNGYITNQIIQKKVKKGIHSRQLLSFSEYAKEIIAKDKKENRVSKILPHTYKVSCTTIIFGDRVAFISPASEGMILVIKSVELAKTQKTLFEAFWDMIPDRK